MMYKRMYVLTEEEYEKYKSSLTEPTPQVAQLKCPEDGREFPNAGMLGHHIKSHVNGFQCNICGKVFKTQRALTFHLKQHPPQVQPSTHSIFDKVLPTAPQAIPMNAKKPHKQRSTINFETSKWMTLKRTYTLTLNIPQAMEVYIDWHMLRAQVDERLWSDYEL